MNALRIRDNGKVRQLDRFPKDKLEVLQKIVSSNTIMDGTNVIFIKKLTEGSPCCICDGIPAFEISFPFPEGGATRIERYCNRCIERVSYRDAGPKHQVKRLNVNQNINLNLKPATEILES